MSNDRRRKRRAAARAFAELNDLRYVEDREAFVRLLDDDPVLLDLHAKDYPSPFTDYNIEMERMIMDAARFDQFSFMMRVRKVGPFMSRLMIAFISADYGHIQCSIPAIALILASHAPVWNNDYVDIMYVLVVKRMCALFFNDKEGVSVFTALGCVNGFRCQDVGHSYCRTMKLLIAYLPEEERNKHFRQVSDVSKKTLLHFIASAGDYCQLNVLLSSGLDPDAFDGSGFVPLHYAMYRKAHDMIRTLLWYGADASLCPMGSFANRTIINGTLPNIPFTYLDKDTYLNMRTVALRDIFTTWAIKACEKAQHFMIHHELSSIHFVKYHTYEAVGKEESEQYVTIVINRQFLEPERAGLKACLFVRPVEYVRRDEFMHASDPAFFVRSSCVVTDVFAEIREGEDLSITENTPDNWQPLSTASEHLTKKGVHAFVLPANVGRTDQCVTYRIRFNFRVKPSNPFPKFSVVDPHKSQVPTHLPMPTVAMVVYAVSDTTPIYRNTNVKGGTSKSKKKKSKRH